jgi:hypothetical protein
MMAKDHPNHPINSRLQRYLVEHERPYLISPGRSVLLMMYGGWNALLPVMFKQCTGSGHLIVEVRLGLIVPPSRLDEAEEWAARASAEIFRGKFRIHRDTGDVYFSTFVRMEEERDGAQTIEAIATRGAHELDIRVPQIVRLTIPSEAESLVPVGPCLSDREFVEMMEQLMHGPEVDFDEDPG